MHVYTMRSHYVWTHLLAKGIRVDQSWQKYEEEDAGVDIHPLSNRNVQDIIPCFIEDWFWSLQQAGNRW